MIAGGSRRQDNSSRHLKPPGTGRGARVGRLMPEPGLHFGSPPAGDVLAGDLERETAGPQIGTTRDRSLGSPRLRSICHGRRLIDALKRKRTKNQTRSDQESQDFASLRLLSRRALFSCSRCSRHSTSQAHGRAQVNHAGRGRSRQSLVTADRARSKHRGPPPGKATIKPLSTRAK